MLKRIFQCCLLNGGFFGLSIFLFDFVLLPIVRLFLSWMFTQNPSNGAVIGNYIVTFLSILFGMIWVMPLFILSKIVNSLWFQVSSSQTTDLQHSEKLNIENVMVLNIVVYFTGYCRFSIQISKGSTAAIRQFQCYYSRYAIFTVSSNIVPHSIDGGQFVTIQLFWYHLQCPFMFIIFVVFV